MRLRSAGTAIRQRSASAWLDLNAGTHSPSLAFDGSRWFNLTAAADLSWQSLDGGASTLAEARSFRPALAGTFRQVRRRQPDFRGAHRGCQGPSWNTQTYGEGGVDGDDGGGGASGIVTVWTFDTARMVTTVQAGATSPNAVSEYA